jgi:hypothetical protein
MVMMLSFFKGENRLRFNSLALKFCEEDIAAYLDIVGRKSSMPSSSPKKTKCVSTDVHLWSHRLLSRASAVGKAPLVDPTASPSATE